jgi:transposase
LPVVEEMRTLNPSENLCPHCHLPPLRAPEQDAVTEFKEVEVRAFIRRIRCEAWVPGCQCKKLPALLLPPPPPQLIPRSDYSVSFWVEVLVGKFISGRPTHRLLQDLGDQGMPVSAGTVAGGLQRLLPLFEPLVEALYCRQMSDPLFWCDETRWEVFVKVEGKIGHRWYLWVFRSASVVFYALEPSRSAAVPGAHFAGLQGEPVIVICDRYSAYKKLARLAGILLAFCWAHVRRDFLEAARGFVELEPWAREWKTRIGALYHLNRQRLAHWDPALPLFDQPGAFHAAHQTLAAALDGVEAEAKRLAAPDPVSAEEKTPPRPTPARQEQRKIARSLLDHWAGLRRFVDHPAIPMDNNGAERALRGPVTGRKNYYGAGSLWSAELTAMLFTLFQTLGLWDIPLRPWLTRYLQACAENGGRPPADLTPFLPWSPVQAPRNDTS